MTPHPLLSLLRDLAGRLGLRAAPLVLAVVAGLAAAASPGHAGTLAEERRGYWTVFAWADNDTGRFSYCGLQTTWTDGRSVILSVQDAGVVLSLRDTDWSIPAGTRGTATLRIDRRYARRHTAVSSDTYTDRLLVLIGWDDVAAFWHAFRLGNSMEIDLPATRWAASLRGTMAAADLMDDCYRQYGGGVRNPFMN